MRSLFERRIERAARLAELWPASREVLVFYGAVARLQAVAADALAARVPEDPGALAPELPRLLDLAEREGPAGLAAAARRWRVRSQAERERVLRASWDGTAGSGGDARGIADLFFPKVLLQPYAVAARLALSGPAPAPEPGEPARSCPFCRHPPAASVLREGAGGDAAARSLLCSLCALEWRYPRVLCPRCGEQSPERLPRFAAEEIAWVRVEACDVCKRYLKAVDLRAAPEAEPMVDELASLPLDVLAREQGYAKLEPNLAGV
ncbi:MAG: formate dehydrogenase accessory protein FdhE [Planctomycetes bacterium]|nr:formate dehydrogenase accessory protein FdhE [Planctomycetota bacterium]